MNNTIIELMNEVEGALCLELDNLITQIEAIKQTEIDQEEYFTRLFDSIFYEKGALHA